ncbi:immunity 22 family protein [Bacteroides ovatus]|nr:immunity 22 family protein [Bacteroides ovatus]
MKTIRNLACQFCKELGVMDYDEDSLIMKYLF